MADWKGNDRQWKRGFEAMLAEWTRRGVSAHKIADMLGVSRSTVRRMQAVLVSSNGSTALREPFQPIKRSVNPPLTPDQVEAIFDGLVAGKVRDDIATEIGATVWTIEKWAVRMMPSPKIKRRSKKGKP